MLTVVIGHRLGEGQHVAKGLMTEGVNAVVIEGMAADMKLGDVMKEHQADLGISFCGSGGAGALMAKNKHGYRSISHIRSIEAAQSAIYEGYQVIGMGFMDTESLGKALAQSLKATKEKS